MIVGIVAFASSATSSTHAQEAIDPAQFTHVITNPLFPISLVGLKVFEGEEIDPDTDETTELRLESRLLPEEKVVAGVTVAVLEERDYEDGDLVEVALDYFAQHTDGTVWYFGEDVDNYEDGVLINHNGAWLAGVDGAQPGIIMPASPTVGQTFQQERAPGVAEDEAIVEAVNASVTVPAGSYNGCLRTLDSNPLEPGTEELKWYCPGVGLVREEGETLVNELVSVAPMPAPSPSPGSTATAIPGSSPTPTGVIAPDTGTRGPDNGNARFAFATGLAVAALAAVAGGWCLHSRRPQRT